MARAHSLTNVSAARQKRAWQKAVVKSILRQNVGWYDTSNPEELASKVGSQVALVHKGLEGPSYGIFIGACGWASTPSGTLTGTPLGCCRLSACFRLLASPLAAATAAAAHTLRLVPRPRAAMGASITGIVGGFTEDWAITLVVLSMAPIIALAVAALATVMMGSTKRQNKAYAKAGGIATEW